jgi:hypothetical protein
MVAEWTRRPFSIMGHVFDYWRLPDDPAEVARWKRSLGFDAEHWLGSAFKTGGDDGHSWLFRTRHGCLEDQLAAYLPAAHAEGLRVLVYVNAHWYGESFDEGMFARTADGRPVAAYGNGALTCPGGPFLQYSLELAEDLGQYEIDGVFLDGPIGSICWCEACRRQYEQRFGEPMPAGRLTLGQRRRLEQLAAERVGRYVGEFRRVLREARPQAVVYHNAAGLGRLTWANRRAVQNEDLLGIEGGFLGYRPLEGQFLYKTTAAGKLLAALAGGTPTVIFCDHAFKRYDYWPMPAPELELMYAASVATGANPWFLLYRSTAETHAAEVARRWNTFIATHAELLADAESAEPVALLWSDSTALVAESAGQEADSIHAQAEASTETAYVPKADPLAAFHGAYSLLARSGIPFRVVTEAEVAAGLEGIELLIAPSAAALEEAAFERLVWFVRRGGALVADDEFAVLDEDGAARDPNRLGVLLGAVRGEPIAAAAESIDYIATGKGWLFRGIGTPQVPRPQRAFRVTPAGGRTRAVFHEPLGGRYDRLPPAGKMPAAVEHAVGGGRVLYLPMNLFEHYRAFGFEPHRRMIENAVRRWHKPLVAVGGLAGFGEVVVRRKPGRLFVHLLNYAGVVRPFAALMPLRGVTVTLHGPPPTRVRALHARKLLQSRTLKTGHRVRLARLETAETLVFDIE